MVYMRNRLTIKHIEDVFEYFSTHSEFNDLEDSIVAGKVTDQESLELQNTMEIFTYEMLRYCVFTNKFYSDEEDYFENYSLYLRYKGIDVIVFILYGQGSYFNIKKSLIDTNKEDVVVNLNDSLDDILIDT